MRIDLSMDPQSVGAAFHAQLSREMCHALDNGMGCEECHTAVAPLVKPFGRLLFQAARQGVKLCYSRFNMTDMDQRHDAVGSGLWDKLALAAVGSLLDQS